MIVVKKYIPEIYEKLPPEIWEIIKKYSFDIRKIIKNINFKPISWYSHRIPDNTDRYPVIYVITMNRKMVWNVKYWRYTYTEKLYECYSAYKYGRYRYANCRRRMCYVCKRNVSFRPDKIMCRNCFLLNKK